MRILILIGVLALVGGLALAALITRLEGRESALAFQLQFIGVASVIAVVVAYIVVPRRMKGQSALIGEDFVRTDPAPQGYTPQAKFDDIVRVILNVSKGRIIGATIATRGLPVHIGRVKTPALVVRAILDRAPENIGWQRSWLPFARLSRDEVRQMLERAETPDIYALLPPGQSYSRADEMFSRDRPPEPLPGRRGLFGPKMGWPLNIKSPQLLTPAGRYVNFMLLQMSENGATTRVLKRSEPLLPVTRGSETAPPPPLDDVLNRLKFMCDLDRDRSTDPVEGMLDMCIEGSPGQIHSRKLQCRFDDDVDICCQIRLEAMESSEPKGEGETG